MKKYCVVISEISRQEVNVEAASEDEAIKIIKEKTGSGNLFQTTKLDKETLIHIKY